MNMHDLQFEPGHVLSAADLNYIIDSVVKRIHFGTGFQVMPMGKQLSVSLQNLGRGGSGGASSVAEGTITAYNADTLTCTINGAATSVAKPLHFQESYYDGLTFTYPNSEAIEYTALTTANQTRTADNGTFTVTQRITPMYFVGEVITVINTSDGWAELGSGKTWVAIAT